MSNRRSCRLEQQPRGSQIRQSIPWRWKRPRWILSRTMWRRFRLQHHSLQVNLRLTAPLRLWLRLWLHIRGLLPHRRPSGWLLRRHAIRPRRLGTMSGHCDRRKRPATRPATIQQRLAKSRGARSQLRWARARRIPLWRRRLPKSGRGFIGPRSRPSCPRRPSAHDAHQQCMPWRMRRRPTPSSWSPSAHLWRHPRGPRHCHSHPQGSSQRRH
mmetsp:Transcript_52994/g.113270  ORF Transcript_52994/g.113270 Transcript_52994/m.113270 type:complete len:213 (-) Transcript_52994:152-790(-)